MGIQKLTITILISFVLLSCSSSTEKIEITPNDYHHAVDKLTSVMIHDIFSPPVASRIYAYPNIASYEVLNQGSTRYKSLANQLNGLEKLQHEASTTGIDLKLASIIAYLDVAKELVFSKDQITSYRDSLYNVWESKNKDAFLQAKNHALPISTHIISWMNTDNYKETRTMPEFNISSDDPSRWQPTPPAYMEGIEPHWNKIRTFSLDSAAQYKPLSHPKFSLKKGSDFYKELEEVYTISQEIRKKGDTSEEIAIAQFWDCNPYVSINKGHFMFAAKKITPGAHWIGICKIACKQTNSDFEKTVFAYTKTSIAITDAFISCWDEKYRSNLIRPETLINKHIDESWEPILQTPPFPEYTSGHSVVSGAASEVLTSIFGDNFSFEDTTEIPYNLPMRKFSSFRVAAEEAAISRMYGGIHYISAVNLGIDQGIKVGEHVNTTISFRKN
ncbi:vanadium-dependent haloperoxidase [Flavobacteriaceae bacterium S356]|uniref:Vanadium-dependent haloperoxidase n=1 Tax=Asprobacillus argus TaxID=3076534 RepID=A0ABU3LGM7_9FLAO|nr:vanadium-dependent haloperoxidase [Flavobacteriaceae bacterium S356]